MNYAILAEFTANALPWVEWIHENNDDVDQVTILLATQMDADTLHNMQADEWIIYRHSSWMGQYWKAVIGSMNVCLVAPRSYEVRTFPEDE